MKTKKAPFDIYIPAIEIEVYTDGSSNETVTPESSILIDKTQARYMGLLVGLDMI